MAVRIRLMRMGKIRHPQYRIVIADSRTKRDGKAIEYVGIYHPKEDPSRIEVKSDRVQHWLSVGAQPSEAVIAILSKTGDWQKFKGLPAPTEPLKVAAPKPDRTAVYEAAAQAAAGLEAPSKPAAKKAEKKSDAKAEAKSDAKTESKAETKPDAKSETKAETKAETKPEAKTDAKAETKADTKSDTKAETKAEAKAEAPAEETAVAPASDEQQS